MRRKSERAATKKAKASPEKKVEKVRRTRTRRGKQSTSSENESGDDNSPVREVPAEAEPEQKPPATPVKQDSPEDGQDQVWQVKAAEGSGDVGEIQKLKICLTRPPSTPERADKSPRSKRKHSRAASSSDASGVETASEEKKKPKHRSKRSTRESKDESDRNQDSQEEGEEHAQTDVSQSQEVSEPSKEVATDETPMSTTNEEMKTDNDSQNKDKTDDSQESETKNKSSDPDTTQMPVSDIDNQESGVNTSAETEEDKSKSDEKSEALGIQTEDSKGDMLDLHPSAAEVEDSREDKQEESRKPAKTTRGEKVSINEGKGSVSEGADSTRDENIKATNKNDVLEGSESDDRRSKRKMSSESVKDKSTEENDGRRRSRELERSESTQSMQEESVHNGQSAPIVVSRKRRWGTRSKVTTQKSITISTDVLKDIIPDVKPVEFDEVIEEKKQHRRIEVSEKVERPILPKIVIDNSENVEQHRREQENDSANIRETNLSSNRRISIVKENDSVLTRPPSPPRHKQSNILFITNLVRPFTLPQLKNLLQRTGRISENGFWIDRIKSKCYVKYETEDQAVETRHALHGVTWPVSNPKALQVDFSTQEAFDKAKLNEDSDNVKTSTIPGTVEDWLREQDMKRDRGELEKPWERKAAMREWDVGKNDKDKEKDRPRREERPLDKRRHRTPERSPEPARKFKKKEEEAPAKLLDDLFRKTKATPCIYWLPLSAETIAVKEAQRRQHMLEHERRLQEFRRTHRRH